MTNFGYEPGQPCWVDLNTTDLPGAVSFYSDLFGWEATDQGDDFGHYHMLRKVDQQVTGIGPCYDAAQRSAWNVYLNTADIEATQELIEQAGGQNFMDVMVIGDAGKMTVSLDAAGTPVGLWEADRFGGTEVHGEHGAPCWFELHTRNYDEAVAFYPAILPGLGLKREAFEGMNYSTVETSGKPWGGIFDASGFLPEDVTGYWQVYFQVDDVDETAARVQQLGGSLIDEVADTPFGRMARVIDPYGAAFVIITVPE